MKVQAEEMYDATKRVSGVTMRVFWSTLKDWCCTASAQG